MKKLSHRSLLGIVLAAGLMGGVAHAQQESTTRNAGATSSAGREGSNAEDQQSQIKEAAQMNMTAIRVAELAQQNGQNPQLKQYAKTLQQDHQQAQKDLERIAQKQSVSLPTSLDAKCQQQVSRLENLSGSEFDREFAKAAVEGHAKGIKKLQQQSSGSSKSAQASTSSNSSDQTAIGSSAQSSTGSNSSDWQQYNQRMLSKMQDHQRQAREVARAVGLDQSTITSLESNAGEDVGSPGSNVERRQSTGSTSRDNSSTSTQEQGSRKDQ